MKKTLIVGLDGSRLAERVLPYAESLATALDAEVVLVRARPQEGVAEPLTHENPHLLPFMVAMPMARPESAAAQVRIEHYEAEHYLDDIARRLGERGIRATSVEVEGSPAKVLVEEALARGAGMILLTTHGRSGLGRWIYRSVAEAVVAHSPVPVFLTRAWASEASVAGFAGHQRILVALDGNEAAERALPVAVQLARALPADVHLVEVVPALGETSLSDEAWLGDSPKNIQRQEEKEAVDYIAKVGNRLRGQGIQVTSTVRVDSVGAGIAVSAGTNDASIVVLATHAHSGIERALFGSIALDVLRRGTLPVLLVGPAVSSEATSSTGKSAGIPIPEPIFS